MSVQEVSGIFAVGARAERKCRERNEVRARTPASGAGAGVSGRSQSLVLPRDDLGRGLSTARLVFAAAPTAYNVHTAVEIERAGRLSGERFGVYIHRVRVRRGASVAAGPVIAPSPSTRTCRALSALN